MSFSAVWWFLAIFSYLRSTQSDRSSLCVWLGLSEWGVYTWMEWGANSLLGGTLASLSNASIWRLFLLGWSLPWGGIPWYVPACWHSGRWGRISDCNVISTFISEPSLVVCSQLGPHPLQSSYKLCVGRLLWNSGGRGRGWRGCISGLLAARR